MQIIIPMSGIGKRFLDAGYREPKPLIKVEQKPMIEHVINMFPEESNFIFICNSDHLKNTNMARILRDLCRDSSIISIDKHKLGPVYAVLKIKDYLDEKENTIINYCDFNVNWDYKDFKEKVEENKCEGALTGYTGFHPHLLRNQLYAGVLLNKNNFVIKIKEKHRFTEDPMRTWHSSGTYYFRRGYYIEKYFTELMKRKISINNEYYVSSVYELLLRDHLPCYGYTLKHFLQWGTPEDFNEYLAWSNLFKKISKKFIKEEFIKFSNIEKRKSFEYWKEYFSQAEHLPHSKQKIESAYLHNRYLAP